jgi:hypothetical protein
MFNEISPGIFFNKSYQYHEICDEDFLLWYRDNQVLLQKSEDDYKIPRRKDFIEIIDSPV